jgi:hypothetical protein
MKYFYPRYSVKQVSETSPTPFVQVLASNVQFTPPSLNSRHQVRPMLLSDVLLFNPFFVLSVQWQLKLETKHLKLVLQHYLIVHCLSLFKVFNILPPTSSA